MNSLKKRQINFETHPELIWSMNRSIVIVEIICGDERYCDIVNTLPLPVPSSVYNGTAKRSPNGIKTKGRASRLNESKHQFALTLARRILVEIGNRIVRLVWNLHHPLRAFSPPSTFSISQSIGWFIWTASFSTTSFPQANSKSNLPLRKCASTISEL